MSSLSWNRLLAPLLSLSSSSYKQAGREEKVEEPEEDCKVIGNVHSLARNTIVNLEDKLLANE